MTGSWSGGSNGVNARFSRDSALFETEVVLAEFEKIWQSSEIGEQRQCDLPGSWRLAEQKAGGALWTIFEPPCSRSSICASI